MSVNSTVANTRSTSTSLREPVRNSSISSTMRSTNIGFVVRDVIDARQFDELRAGNMVGDIAAGVDRNASIAGAVQNQCRDLDRRQYVAGVDLAAAGLALCRSRRAWARRRFSSDACVGIMYRMIYSPLPHIRPISSM
jgi:hypothetical protein